jgi:hypothetical protein
MEGAGDTTLGSADGTTLGGADGTTLGAADGTTLGAADTTVGTARLDWRMALPDPLLPSLCMKRVPFPSLCTNEHPFPLAPAVPTGTNT